MAKKEQPFLKAGKGYTDNLGRVLIYNQDRSFTDVFSKQKVSRAQADRLILYDANQRRHVGRFYGTSLNSDKLKKITQQGGKLEQRGANNYVAYRVQPSGHVSVFDAAALKLKEIGTNHFGYVLAFGRPRIVHQPEKKKAEAPHWLTIVRNVYYGDHVQFATAEELAGLPEANQEDIMQAEIDDAATWLEDSAATVALVETVTTIEIYVHA